MKIIKRPDSTTVAVETLYHLIKDSTEVKNIFDAASPGTKVVPMLRMVNEKTFQPQVGFRLINPDAPFESEYYIATIEHLIDSGVDIKQFEL